MTAAIINIVGQSGDLISNQVSPPHVGPKTVTIFFTKNYRSSSRPHPIALPSLNYLFRFRRQVKYRKNGQRKEESPSHTDDARPSELFVWAYQRSELTILDREPRQA